MEEEHAKELKKLCRTTAENLQRPDTRQGSYVRQVQKLNFMHEKMVEHRTQFALELHQMHTDLDKLSIDMERGRKHWKQAGLTAEQKVKDAENMMEKAKAKY